MKKRLQGFLAGVIVSCMVLASIPAFADSFEALFNVVNIKINGVQVAKIGDNYILSNGDQVPYSISYKGTTYLPMRRVAELVGKEVVWDGGTMTANINDKVTPSTTTKTNEEPTPKPIVKSGEAEFINDTWVVNVNASDLPCSIDATNGMSLTINSIKAKSSGIMMNITMTNNSSVSDKGQPMISTWEIYDGENTLDYLDMDDNLWVNYLRCGQSIKGNVAFKGLSHETDQIILYGGLWQYIDRESFKVIINLD